ncbi:MAG: hypothetical protein ACH350_04885 [Parachlamydiaceae bacterium]
MKKGLGLFFVLGLFFAACSSSSSSSFNVPRGEYIFRHHDESLIQIQSQVILKRAPYPWEEDRKCDYPKITKDFFRCRGSNLNPVNLIQKGKEIIRFYDCGGSQKHSLPLRDQKEFVYPILIDLLNYIQTKIGKRVVVTCGHCCPEHNAYLDPSGLNQSSKHMLGAEVDFYVQGMEEHPERIIDVVFQYYLELAKYKGQKEFLEFKRYEKANTSVKVPSWYNKEIFMKLYRKNEGRDFDNRHPYPYVSIQVRYDWETKEAVIYSWDKAFHNFHRR